MVVIIFRSRLRGDVPADMEPLGQRMYQLATGMPGFLSYQEFTAQDGENVAIVEFESAETLQSWRDHPEHRAAQQRGREAYYAEYRVQVCSVIRESVFPPRT